MNKPLNRIAEHDNVSLEQARVTDVRGGVCFLQTDWGNAKARPAVSCLVQPQAGDLVLVSFAAESAHILAILEREDTLATLAFPGDVRIAAPNGELTLSSGGPMRQHAPEIMLVGGETRVTTEDLEVDARRAQLRSDDTRLFSRIHTAVVDMLNQRARLATRCVDETEVTNSGNLIQSVRNLLTIRSKSAIIDTQKDLKIDGEHIHMG
ncbi:MAG: DUF3540 domain-containing protein [Gammaproteobacteria bacterium]